MVMMGALLAGCATEPIEGKVEARRHTIECLSGTRLLEVRVQEGDYVKAGDTLAIVDAPEPQWKRRRGEEREPVAVPTRREKRKRERQAFMMLQQAKAGLEQAEREFRRAARLFDEGKATAEDRDAALVSYKAMEAQVKAAQDAQSRIQETAYVTWLEGEVANVYRGVGEQVDSGQPLVDIDILSDLSATFCIPKSRMKGKDIGSKLKAHVPAFDTHIELEIVDIEDGDTVKARPLGRLEGLRPGMSLIIKD